MSVELRAAAVQMHACGSTCVCLCNTTVLVTCVPSAHCIAHKLIKTNAVYEFLCHDIRARRFQLPLHHRLRKVGRMVQKRVGENDLDMSACNTTSHTRVNHAGILLLRVSCLRCLQPHPRNVSVMRPHACGVLDAARRTHLQLQ